MSKWTDTSVTRLLGIDYPILSGSFGRGGSTAFQAGMISNLGGLGSFGANELAPEDILKTTAEIRKLTAKPFGLNLWVSTYDEGGDTLDQATYDRVVKLLEPYYRELGMEPPPMAQSKPRDFNDQVVALIEAGPAVFSFVFGIPPAEILQTCRKRGIVTAGGASSVEEAVALEAAGVDIAVASGLEAGGHRTAFLKPYDENTQIGTFALVPQIADRVKIPVVAAGGIADGRGIAAALALGADAAQIGTAFFACDESGASKFHRELFFSGDAPATGFSRAFTGRHARGFYNRFATEMKQHDAVLARYPAQSWITGPLRAAAVALEHADIPNLWAGQGAPLVRYRKTDELFAALIAQTEDVLHSRTA